MAIVHLKIGNQDFKIDIKPGQEIVLDDLVTDEDDWNNLKEWEQVNIINSQNHFF